ncbi:MAG: hypothetical protein WAX07_00875 [Candidatus Altiarchaeia archaeon]
MRPYKTIILLLCCLILSGIYVHAYEYPVKVLYLRDLGTRYTGEIVSFTAEVITPSEEECKSCRVWFYVDGPDWEGDNWIGYAPYSDYAKSGLYTLDWKIAPGMSAGTYTYYAQVKSPDGNARSGSSEEYAFRIVKENMRARVIGLWPVDDSPAGADVNFLAQITNNGDTALDHNCQVKFHVTASSAEGSQKYAAGSRSCTTDDFAGATDVLSVGGTRWYKLPWTLPHAPGKYAYYATVEYKGREINDIPPAYSFNVIEPRKASIISLLPVSDARTGSSVTLGARVENSADIVLADGCRIAYYASGPAKAGLKLEGIIGYSDCVQTGSDGLSALSYEEQRDYSTQWKPPIAGEYKYKAVVKYGETEISPWSTEQSFRVGDNVTTTTFAEETETIEEIPEPEYEETYSGDTLPEDEPITVETTTTTSTTQAQAAENEENESTQAPKVAGNATSVELDNPLISLVSIAVIISAALYILYRASMKLKKTKKENKA